MNHFINISDLSKSELRSIIDGAKKRKSERGEKPNSQPDSDQPIKGKTVLFPPHYTHKHKGVVSLTQEKYIVTGWFTWNNR